MSLTDWIKVTRVQTAAVTMLALWGGHITVAPLTIRSTLYLGLLGLLVHIWGFTMNEVEDAEYDKKHSDKSTHPISTGKVSDMKANMLAWGSLIAFILIHISNSPMMFEWNVISVQESDTYALIMVTGGYLYNKKSKKAWYSPVYLSAWAFSLVMLGAYHAGIPNYATILLGFALAVQIFIQVIEGDLKDIDGPENTFLEKIGVRYDSNSIPSKSKYFIKTMKFFEALLLYGICLLGLNTLSTSININTIDTVVYTIVVTMAVSVMVGTSTMWLSKNLNRDQVKKLASVHEIISIIVIGICLVPYDAFGGLLVMLAPPTWYILTNKLMYASSLSPDI